MKISPPSNSLSKTTLIITPLFILILSILFTTYDISYLFILQFTENVASDADLNLIPSMRKINNNQQFTNNFLIKQIEQEIGIYENISKIPRFQNIILPFIKLQEVSNWLKKHPLARGFSPRWIVPVTTEKAKLDCMLLIINNKKQKQIGLGQRAKIQYLEKNEVALSEQIIKSLKISVGDRLRINIQPLNLFQSNRLLNKFQDIQSQQEYIPDKQQFNIKNLLPVIQYAIDQAQLNFTITEKEITIIQKLINKTYSFDFQIVQSVKPQGAWANSLHNVIVADQSSIQSLANQIFQELIKEIRKQYTIDTFLPFQLPFIFPFSVVNPYITRFINQYAPIVSVTFNKRTQFYVPQQQTLHLEYNWMLQNTPDNIEVLPINTFYELSLGIKYFFDSIIQIFTFISILLYVNVMRIILKQVYDQKQIEIGVWRTLGIGGVKMNHENIQRGKCDKFINKIYNYFNKQNNQNDQDINEQNKNKIALTHQLTLYDDLLYKWYILKNIGHFPYWFINMLISVLLYVALKYFYFYIICKQLNYDTIKIGYVQPLILFIILLLYSQISCVFHIIKIYKNSIVESMKPFKRTFDVVKIRIIKMANLGLSPQYLLVAIMLIYYGLVSYYFIPRAILYDKEQLQTILFNSIFFMMILGAIILISVVQSFLEILILKLSFLISKNLKNMKSIILKNLKAKKFSNLNISLSLALIFAFVLFFTSGIKMEINLIQSFIKRALGSDLTLENYQKNSFNDTIKINQYLNSNQNQIKYAWFSKSLNRQTIEYSFVDYRRIGRNVNAQFRVFSPNYLNATYYNYYVPQSYLDGYDYQKLPNGIKNGFNTIYQNNNSVGKYDPKNTISNDDPYQIISSQKSFDFNLYPNYSNMVKEEQIINLAISNSLKKKLGATVGFIYKLQLRNSTTGRKKFIRAKITHILNTLPGSDPLWDKAFMSIQQAEYLYKQMGVNISFLKYEKLNIMGSQQNIKNLASNLLLLSPPHTEITQIQFVSASFYILEQYLEKYITLLSVTMNSLSVVLLYLYTKNKCDQENQMYKILRSIGTPVLHIRFMVFLEVIIRILVSISIGILFGSIASLVFAHQVQTLLMVTMPSLDLTIVLTMSGILSIVFTITLILSTKKLQQVTIAQMSKHS